MWALGRFARLYPRRELLTAGVAGVADDDDDGGGGGGGGDAATAQSSRRVRFS